MRAQDHSLAHAKKIRRRCTTRKRWLREDRDKLWDLRGRYPRAKWAEIKELGSFDRTPGALREEYRLQERQKQQQLNPSTEEERFVQPTPESNVVVLRLGARAAGHLGAMEGSAPANLVEQDRDDAMSISSGEDISHEYRTDPPATAFLKVHDSPERGQRHTQIPPSHAPITNYRPPPSSSNASHNDATDTSNAMSTAPAAPFRTTSPPAASTKRAQNDQPDSGLSSSITIPVSTEGLTSKDARTAFDRLLALTCEIHANENHVTRLKALEDDKKELLLALATKDSELAEKDKQLEAKSAELSSKVDGMTSLRKQLKEAEVLLSAFIVHNQRCYAQDLNNMRERAGETNELSRRFRELFNTTADE